VRETEGNTGYKTFTMPPYFDALAIYLFGKNIFLFIYLGPGS